MNIDDDHMYHGAALIQIAESPQFTAINALKLGKEVVRVAYRINDDIAVYFKYATKPNAAYGEYVFTFTKDHLAELAAIAASAPKTFIALVCVKDREICCISHSTLADLAARREKAAGHPEDTLTVLVTAPENKSLRVYVNAPGKKGSILGKAVIVSRSAFPKIVFE